MLPLTRHGKRLVPTPLPFWLKPFSTFGLSYLTMFNQAFTCVCHTTHPSPISVVVLTDTSLPHGSDASQLTVGTLSEGSVQVVTFLYIFVGYR